MCDYLQEVDYTLLKGPVRAYKLVYVAADIRFGMWYTGFFRKTFEFRKKGRNYPRTRKRKHPWGNLNLGRISLMRHATGARALAEYYQWSFPETWEIWEVDAYGVIPTVHQVGFQTYLCNSFKYVSTEFIPRITQAKYRKFGVSKKENVNEMQKQKRLQNARAIP